MDKLTLPSTSIKNTGLKMARVKTDDRNIKVDIWSFSKESTQ